MIFFVFLELMLIVSYLFHSPLLGGIVFSVILFWLFSKRYGTIDWIVSGIISSLPISYLEITCEIGFHIFKWYNLFVFLLAVYLFVWILRSGCKFGTTFHIVFLIFIIQFFRTLFVKNFRGGTVELLQECITIIPVLLFQTYLDSASPDLNCRMERLSIKWVNLYYWASVSCAFGVLFQYFLYTTSGITVGFSSWHSNRHIFDLLFTGFSVLSVFLGSGIIVAVNKILSGESFMPHFIAILLLGTAISVNTSRTGLISAILTIGLMVFSFMRIRKQRSHTLLFTLPVCAAVVLSVYLLVKNRSALQGGNLFSGNGRIELAKRAFQLMLNNPVNLLFGIGLSSASEAQHNMFLEIWVLNGTIEFAFFLFLFIAVLRAVRTKSFRYLIWHIFISHQFISSFFATTLTLPVMLIALTSPSLQRTSNVYKPIERQIHVAPGGGVQYCNSFSVCSENRILSRNLFESSTGHSRALLCRLPLKIQYY